MYLWKRVSCLNWKGDICSLTVKRETGNSITSRQTSSCLCVCFWELSVILYIPVIYHLSLFLSQWPHPNNIKLKELFPLANTKQPWWFTSASKDTTKRAFFVGKNSKWTIKFKDDNFSLLSVCDNKFPLIVQWKSSTSHPVSCCFRMRWNNREEARKTLHVYGFKWQDATPKVGRHPSTVHHRFTEINRHVSILTLAVLNLGQLRRNVVLMSVRVSVFMLA